MYNIIAIIISILSLIAICLYAYFLYGKYTKESRMARYAYLKVKEKFDMFLSVKSLKKRNDIMLKTGIFQIQYIDKCISKEELIANKLLNLQYNNIDTTNIIVIDYYDNIINLNIELYTKTDSIYGVIYQYSFGYKINKKDDIILFLNKLELIEIIRNAVLDARKINNLSGIEKNNIIKKNINKNINYM